jgi:hypothetical protein
VVHCKHHHSEPDDGEDEQTRIADPAIQHIPVRAERIAEASVDRRPSDRSQHVPKKERLPGRPVSPGQERHEQLQAGYEPADEHRPGVVTVEEALRVADTFRAQ